MATPQPSANTPTPRPHGLTRAALRDDVAAASRRPAESFLSLRRACALLLIVALIFGCASDSFAQSRRKKKKKPTSAPCANCAPAISAPDFTAAFPGDEVAQRELSDLARALHNDAPGAYDKLAAFASRTSGTLWSARAALALGYSDQSKNRPQQALAWFERAKTDSLLREYILYWGAQAKHASKRAKEALADLETIQREFPNTAMKEQVVEALAITAVELGKPQEAIDALDSYSATATKTNLLLARAHARQVARQLAKAAADYQTLYYKFPLSDEAKPAGSALPGISRQLGKEYVHPTPDLQLQRAQVFFDARKWREAHAEFEKLRAMLPKDSNDALRQRADLRSAQARVQLNGSPKVIEAVRCSDPEVDAERLYVLSQAWRPRPYDTRRGEKEMFAALDELIQKYPSGRWTEEALMAEANYFWVQLDRPRAAQNYRRVLDAFPAGKYAQIAEWRISWASYLDRKPESEGLILAFLEKYPSSPYTSNALYWLGRSAERAGNPAHARSHFKKCAERFVQSYFGHVAQVRLAALGPGEVNPAEVVDKIPPPPPLRPLDEPIPAAVADRWARAQALRMIAFDASAELELKSAFFATGSPRLLLEAAQAAFDQGHFAAGMAYARIVIPGSEARTREEVPLSAWKALFPLPYEAALRREASKNGLDPYLVAGLSRQESTFQADAVSPKNAVGLMQILPKTGRLLSKQLRLKYSNSKLSNPEFNLALGTVYLKGLIQSFGGLEQALAAYNAGEDRISAWSAERKYDEIAELVESIPFTETREYIQIVLRNAEAYRMIYSSPAQGPQVWR